MKKSFLLIIAGILLIAAFLCLSSCEEYTSADVTLEYTLNDDGMGYTLSSSNISGLSIWANWDKVSVTIPEEYNGLPVTAIGKNAFIRSSMLQSIVLPNTITEIEDSAFEDCYSLIEIAIPDKVTSIGSYAFAYCDNLKHAYISASVSNMGTNVFNHCYSLEEIAVDPDNKNFTSIDGNLYAHNERTLLYYCPQNKNTEFIMPTSVRDIEENAIRNCDNIETITLSPNVTSIPTYAFAACSNLSGVYVPEENNYFKSIDGNIYSKDGSRLYRFYNIKAKHFDIPNHVKYIEPYTFALDNYLKTITIPEGVCSIGRCAFIGCNIEEITIPKSVTEIERSAFFMCESLKIVHFEDPSGWIGFYDYNGQQVKFADFVISMPRVMARFLTEEFSNFRWKKFE